MQKSSKLRSCGVKISFQRTSRKGTAKRSQTWPSRTCFLQIRLWFRWPRHWVGYGFYRSKRMSPFSQNRTHWSNFPRNFIQKVWTLMTKSSWNGGPMLSKTSPERFSKKPSKHVPFVVAFGVQMWSKKDLKKGIFWRYLVSVAQSGPTGLSEWMLRVTMEPQRSKWEVKLVSWRSIWSQESGFFNECCAKALKMTLVFAFSLWTLKVPKLPIWELLGLISSHLGAMSEPLRSKGASPNSKLMAQNYLGPILGIQQLHCLGFCHG